jgi:hypothetical protein
MQAQQSQHNDLASKPGMKEESLRESEKKGAAEPGVAESGKKMMEHASEAVKEKAKTMKNDENVAKLEDKKVFHQTKYEEHKEEAKEHGESFIQAVKDATMNVVHKTAEMLGINSEEGNQDKDTEKHSDTDDKRDWSAGVDHSSHITSANIDYSSHIRTAPQ